MERLRTHYDLDGPEGPFHRVLVIDPQDGSSPRLYCPPLAGESAWVRTFDHVDDAISLASSIVRKMPDQALPLMTRDHIEWWLIGLKKAEQGKGVSPQG